MVVVSGHEVSSVLSGPVCMAVHSGWNDEDCVPCRNIAHCTRNVFIVYTVRRLVSRTLIFNSIHIAESLSSSSTLVIFRIVGHACILY